MLDRRLQLLLDVDRYERVALEAKRRRTSIAAVIRDAIDHHVPVNDEQRRAAVRAVLAADPMPVPGDPADLRSELDAAHDPVAR